MDIEELEKTQIRLLESVKQLRSRPIVGNIISELVSEPRIKLLRGLRGVGKTTIMLQLLNKVSQKAFYFSADSPLVTEDGIYKTSKELISRGYEILFIDEVHTHPNWRNDLKSLYDEFPKIALICSGSAPLALIPERREKEYTILPMTLREFLYIKYAKEQEAKNLWIDRDKSLEFVAKNDDVERAYKEYVEIGGFPVSLNYNKDDALNSIFNTIRKSVREDSVSITKLSLEKTHAMESLLIRLATSPPGELSLSSLSNNLRISKTSVAEIVKVLEEMKVIRLILPYARGAKLIRAEPKILFTHPNLRVAICRQLHVPFDIGSIREESVLFGLESIGGVVNTLKGAKKSPDYIVNINGEKIVIEIGGNSKTKIQLSEFNQFETILIGDYQIKTLLLE
ncbi:ATP-binding protein [Candidatus Micrarchaeota archaeon]|nr:ATP-binding protein [Candidatus Micrarchaeota archaeon]